MRQDDNIAAISTTCRACARARATDVGARERNLQFAVLRAFNKHRKRLDKNPIDDGDDDDDDANGRKAAGRRKRAKQGEQKNMAMHLRWGTFSSYFFLCGGKLNKTLVGNSENRKVRGVVNRKKKIPTPNDSPSIRVRFIST